MNKKRVKRVSEKINCLLSVLAEENNARFQRKYCGVVEFLCANGSVGPLLPAPQRIRPVDLDAGDAGFDDPEGVLTNNVNVHGSVPIGDQPRERKLSVARAVNRLKAA
jgi:hypothetical protein